MRRAHDALKNDAYVEDKTTGELHRPHHIDLKTGMYRGRQVMKVKETFLDRCERHPCGLAAGGPVDPDGRLSGKILYWCDCASSALSVSGCGR